MWAPKATTSGQPVAILGAGDLVSHVHRGDDPDDAANYRFNIFRLGRDLRVTQEFRPVDLRDLVKLCQVLAFAMTDDGWLPNDSQDALRGLFEDLDQLTQNWSEANDA